MQIRALLKLVLPGIFCLVHAAPLAADHDGDINIDGAVDVVDVLWGQQALHETRSLSPVQEMWRRWFQVSRSRMGRLTLAMHWSFSAWCLVV